MNEKLSPDHSEQFQNSNRVDFSKYREQPPATNNSPSPEALNPSPETPELPSDFDTDTLLLDNSPLKTEVEIANNPSFKEKYQQLLDQLKSKLRPVIASILLASVASEGLANPTPTLESTTQPSTITQEVFDTNADQEWEQLLQRERELQRQREMERQDEPAQQEMNTLRAHGEYLKLVKYSGSYSHVDSAAKTYQEFLNANQLDFMNSDWDRLISQEQQGEYFQLSSDFLGEVCQQQLSGFSDQDRQLGYKLVAKAGANTSVEQVREKLDVKEANLLAMVDLEKSVPGGVRLLHERCGIENFYRYRPADLVRQCQLLQSIDNQANPNDQLKGYVLYVYAHADHNLAFNKTTEKDNYAQIDTLGDGYANIFLEASLVTEFAHLVKNTTDALGKSDALVVRGHGLPSGITLGRPRANGDTWNTSLNVLEYLRQGTPMGDAVEDGGPIILGSCSAGTSELQLDDNPVTSEISFGADLSVNTPGHPVYAADEVSYFLHLQYQLDENGRIQTQPTITTWKNNQEIDITNRYENGILDNFVLDDGQIVSGDHYPQHAFKPEQLGPTAQEVFEITSLLAQARPDNIPRLEPGRLAALNANQQNEIVRFFVEDGSVQNPAAAIEVMTQMLPHLGDVDHSVMTVVLQDYLKFNLDDPNYFVNLDLIANKILPDKQENYQKFKQAVREVMTSDQSLDNEQITAIFKSLPAGYWEPLVLYLQNNRHPQAETFKSVSNDLGQG